jgi:hypothetical protein
VQVGDLVRHKASKNQIGFITASEKGRGVEPNGMLYFVRLPLTGKGWWTHPSKIEVISASR